MKLFYAILLASAVSIPAQAQQTVGLFAEDTATQQGFVLFGSMFGKSTYLIDKCGKSIHSWTSTYTPGLSAYLLPDGSLLRTGNVGNSTFSAGGTGGIIERQSWNGSLQWSYNISTSYECQHHDICYMPNGNILAVVWEKHDPADAAANGRDTTLTGAEVWSEKIVELQPVGTNQAIKVWEWHVWDHLVQEMDPTLANYAPVALHPELININYIGHNTPKSPDWLHMNSVTYNAQLDQIMVSSYYFDELWIIDHSTTPIEAIGHSGGKRHKGGDLLYRWGNAQAYNIGSPTGHVLYSPHDPQWIPEGYPGAGNITLFNNGAGRPDGNYSSVEEIQPPVDDSGNYFLQPATAYGPAYSLWRYQAPNPTDFFSAIISGAQRLSGGHTLITEGTKGNLLEVNKAGNVLWRYVSPAIAVGVVAQGSPASPGNSVFRALQYSSTYAGLVGRTLTPGAPLEIAPLAYNCYFTNRIVTPSSVSNIAQVGGAQVVNPVVGAELRLRPSVDAPGARLMLLNALGQLCGSWSADLHGGAWISLPLASISEAPGLYTLHITAENGVRSSLAVLR